VRREGGRNTTEKKLKKGRRFPGLEGLHNSEGVYTARKRKRKTLLGKELKGGRTETHRGGERKEEG